jgi:hypothetical protein|tara:strand:+ start:1395 stop:1577 length:183 start_codon:yes stop_codon:yes gene_type:complete
MISPLSIQEGVTFGGLKDFDLTNIAKLLLWKSNAKEFTLKVAKDIDDYHINIEIKEIKHE